MDNNTLIPAELLDEPLVYPAEAYISKDYAEAEGDKLWSRVWQIAGRVEEIPDVGSYITYDIGTDSILIVRSTDESIKAYHNVCPHRGRKLVSTPAGANQAVGKKDQAGEHPGFFCNYHGWTFNLEGQATYIHDKDDWKGALNENNTCLTSVQVDTWGGWIWINMDPQAGPLREYLEPVASLMDPFQFDKMRYRFRQFGIFECNWKVALEAFLEPYHVAATHPQLSKYGDYYAYSKALGFHGNTGFDTRKGGDTSSSDNSVHRAAKGADPRVSIAQMQQEYWDTIGASTSETLVKTAQTLVDELPEGTPASEVHHYWLDKARKVDAERGVIWPEISEKQMADAGLALSIFPNFNIIPGPTFGLYYRVRPYGTDPDKCIYEAVALDLFPEGEEPQTEWIHAEQDPEQWPFVIAQDISNMVEVQKGLKSRGFRGNLPNPHQEKKVTNLHRMLAYYMGTGVPREME
ncbi:SRPBCC family protein [Pseudomaricurvus sp. HS19]|uniref:aromatic ring-hydroxylating oxygenase subunit alpha n=1 Tax=Pseudomaricurvus sp. HS19 TaxID=2692626 RepID=UPI0013689E9B|nr:aromatic ring-hydroxylating dioxygenase subunit alpha [Pseudomaricurvus sp. HS19]MYM62408.1 Rieske 2Fe-2S domain-containing protein [Pseudomaricurvus sp. HS19]